MSGGYAINGLNYERLKTYLDHGGLVPPMEWEILLHCNRPSSALYVCLPLEKISERSYAGCGHTLSGCCSTDIIVLVRSLNWGFSVHHIVTRRASGSCAVHKTLDDTSYEWSSDECQCAPLLSSRGVYLAQLEVYGVNGVRASFHDVVDFPGAFAFPAAWPFYAERSPRGKNLEFMLIRLLGIPTRTLLNPW
ncbi:hypothetical protein HYFRA_00010516 [Hymenoscyphus fraxineus]|uniref:Uncharacterized protein n=1 Tax=Hymenoscyphus fraxineus TaxID=746836 RepID=A0A9N9PKY2_9HELO|nr:hypothetical protein HYFRA_00010516 [Hymenoscyphus fraxineus]